MEVQEASEKAVAILDEAKTVTVKDLQGYIKAGELWVAIQKMKEKIDSTFKPIYLLLFQLNKAGRRVKRIMEAYNREQEQIRQKENHDYNK